MTVSITITGSTAAEVREKAASLFNFTQETARAVVTPKASPAQDNAPAAAEDKAETAKPKPVKAKAAPQPDAATEEADPLAIPKFLKRDAEEPKKPVGKKKAIEVDAEAILELRAKMKTRLAAFAKKYGDEPVGEVRELLKEYGAAMQSQVPDDKFEEFMGRAEEIMETYENAETTEE